MSVDGKNDLEEHRRRLVQLLADRAGGEAQEQTIENTEVLTNEAAAAEGDATAPEDTALGSHGPTAHRLADAPEHGFAEIVHHGSRKAALAEYRRTIEEFREAGAIQEKEWGDFAHLINPYGLQAHVYDAHCQAVAAIGEWQDAQERQAWLARVREDQRVADIRDWEAAKTRRPEDDEQDLAAWREMQEARHQAHPSLPPPEPAPPPPPLPQIRGVEFDARAPSKLYSYQEDGPLLELERPETPPSPPDIATEALLREMIGECHFLMREVSFRSMCQAHVLEDRRDWVETSMKLAKTGATVAKAIGKLRHGPAAREVHHFNTVTKVIAAAQGGGG